MFLLIFSILLLMFMYQHIEYGSEGEKVEEINLVDIEDVRTLVLITRTYLKF